MMSLTEKVEIAIERAESGLTKLTADVFNIPGFSSRKNRILLNSLCEDATRYLEIGTWYGSTLVSSAWENKGEFYAIDNFSQFKEEGKDVRELLAKHIGMLNNKDSVKFIDGDFRSVAPVSNIDVFFYDGNHSAEETEEALKMYKPFLSKESIVIVDDLELTPSVREGIEKGTVGWNIEKTWELKKKDGYHEGLWLGVVHA